ncbi:oligopeptidase A [Oleiphilus sp. HI0068]|uniref:M3 family metallopeptidase n=1 Tax=Oleiphilus sp. HI0061 TaxID=1822239 RepID=UPI0007D01B92|nr:M3 family metallopeptidase [Oleiphilus sp. HI0061]KZY59446.1 oligopeptidase A [Oleiphilus sp. HI0061]KZY77075.1 oligopeptidase A [Oleiphilus sp. HI0068]KZY81103.1 oligopeptidase A [Oleiphilus sp. HI0069]
MNPLLADSPLPLFEQITLEHFEPALDKVLADNRALVEKLVTDKQYSWQDFAYPIESADDRLNNVWSVISHYNAVLNSDELREIYKRLIAKLTEYSTEMGQNKDLFLAYQALADSDEYAGLSQAQKQSIKHTLRGFKLSGVALEDDEKEAYSALKKEMSELTNSFSENVLDATQSWTLYFEDVDSLAGLPESALQLLESQARAKGHEKGYLITLDIPSYLPVMTYCDDANIREQLYQACLTRASDQGPDAGKWDNSNNIQRILTCRQALAKLLSFDNHAERSLATKMADTPDEVIEFLEQLAGKAIDYAKNEVEELKAYMKEEFGVAELNPWDVGYYSEKLRQARFDISQEALKPYFPAPVVLQGMFDVVQKLFGIEVKERPEVKTFHQDARYYSIYSEGEEVAGFYLDIYARKDKRGGAWMADCRARRRLADGSVQMPVAFLACNFTPPVADESGNLADSLLTHNEVTTLFHEFGHGLHHMLTKVDVAGVSGISGVPWDVVELPSQFLENWCWQEESIAMISRHYQTGEALPKDMLDKMLAAKYFQSGMMMMRQLEFALFDFLLHRDYSEADNTDVQAVLESVRERVAVIDSPEYTRFSHSFSHIFAGGYSAGYYSYKWAEVLAADAFSRFEEEGVFNVQTGKDYKEKVLEVGGSIEAIDMFTSFRGRKPSVEPLLKQAGIKV